MRKLKLYYLPVLIVLIGLLSQCAVDPEDDILAPENEEPTTKHTIAGWVWAYNSDDAVCNVYHTEDMQMWASFSAEMHPMIRVFEAGLINSNLNYSQWMAKGNQIYAFTDGILDHGDHGHIVLPLEHKTITLHENANLVHNSCSSNGQMVAFADDSQQSLHLINVQDGKVTTIEQGSAHSSVILAGDYVITTAATSTGEKWAKLVYISTGEVEKTLEIGAGAHGDVYYDQNNTAFIACDDGIYVVNVDEKKVEKRIPYGEEGRTNFLYHAPGEAYAVGLHKTDSGTSDKFILLDMASETLEYITIPNAQLDWNISLGLFALAREGRVAVFSDKSKAKIYHVTLETREIITLDSPNAASPVTVSYDGTHVWVLSDQTISRIYVPANKVEDTFAVPAGTDWIRVTTYKTGAELYDNEKHEF